MMLNCAATMIPQIEERFNASCHKGHYHRQFTVKSNRLSPGTRLSKQERGQQFCTPDPRLSWRPSKIDTTYKTLSLNHLH
jgi:Ni/Co efflux regulator RcnB